jgi:hypothetical protein
MPEKVVNYYKDREMVQRNNCKDPEDNHRSGKSAEEQRGGSRKIATVGKVIRAITAIAVFGVPLITGTGALLGYGAYKAYKRMTKRS